MSTGPPSLPPSLPLSFSPSLPPFLPPPKTPADHLYQPQVDHNYCTTVMQQDLQV